jgi:ribosome-binding protein aMBF1 (putative translation factor)
MKKNNQKLKLISADDLHHEMMRDPEYRREYEKLETEFQIARQIIDARIKRKMTQEELAKKINTGQAVISRLEGMEGKPSISLLERIARALGIKMQITIQ